MPDDLSRITFASAKEWEKWLTENYSGSRGIWLKLAKKGNGIASVSPQEALEVALCYGWIDGQLKKFDDMYYLVKYTPRGPRSIWSKRNRGIAARLAKEHKMQPAGLKQIEAAKKNGRWEDAYDSSKNMAVPADFLRELAKDPKAEAFYKTLNKANRYAIAWRLATAKKPETRQRRMHAMLTMMADGQKLH